MSDLFRSVIYSGISEKICYKIYLKQEEWTIAAYRLNLFLNYLW